MGVRTGGGFIGFARRLLKTRQRTATVTHKMRPHIQTSLRHDELFWEGADNITEWSELEDIFSHKEAQNTQKSMTQFCNYVLLCGSTSISAIVRKRIFIIFYTSPLPLHKRL